MSLFTKRLIVNAADKLDFVIVLSFKRLSRHQVMKLLVTMRLLSNQKRKSNYHYTRGSTPKRVTVTSGRAHLRGLARATQLARWLVVSDTDPI